MPAQTSYYTYTPIGSGSNAEICPCSPNFGLLANRPQPGNIGAVYIATDAQFIYIDDGTNWLEWAGIFPTIAPVNDLNLVPPSTNAFSSYANGGVFYGVSATGTGVHDGTFTNHLWTRIPYGITYTITLSFEEIMSPNFLEGQWGLALYDTLSGKHIVFGRSYDGFWNLTVRQYSDVNTLASTVIHVNHPKDMSRFLRLTDDGTNRIYSCSSDGSNFVTFLTELNTNFLTANQIGVCVQQNQCSDPNYGMFLTNWTVT